MSYTRSYQKYSYEEAEGYAEQSVQITRISSSTSGSAVQQQSHTESKSILSSFSEAYDTDDSRSEPIIDQYVVIADYTPDSTQVGSIALREGQIVEVLDSNNSLRWMVRTRPSKYLSPRQGWIPSTYLERKTAETTLRSLQNIMDLEYEIRSDSKEREAAQKRRSVIKELVETEEEFVKDMEHVVNTYVSELDNPRLPKELRDQREAIFMNFRQICDFHNNVLIKGVQYYAGEPHRLGTTFLRLERDFDMHARYCQEEPQAQALLATSPVKDFFEEYSKRIGEINKSLSDHLKLPIQRINDYQLLLKELIKYTSRLKEDCTELQKALELMQSIPQRAHDLKFINSIEGFKGNIHKLGRLLRHQDWFAITEADGRTKERYLFLFKSRIFVTKVKRLSETRSKYILKDIIRLSDVDIHEVTDDLKSFEFHHKNEGQPRYPLRLQAQTELVKDAWLKELREGNTDIATAAADFSEDGIESTRDESLSPIIQEVPEEITFEPIEEIIEEAVIKQADPTPKPSVQEQVGEEPKSKDKTTAPKTQAAPPAVSEPKLDLDLKAASPKRKSSEKEEVSSPKVQLLDSFEEEQNTVLTEGIQSGSATPMDANEFQDGTSRPRFRKSLKGATCIRGDTATLECELVSVPSATVAWLKDNVPLSEAGRVQFVVKGNTQYLVVKDAGQQDSGLYTCKATNTNGAASCSAQLNVQEPDSKHNHPVSPGPKPPEFTIHFKDTELLEGTSVRFLVKVRANPDANVKFTKNGKPLKEDDRIQIVIEDSGTFELSIGHVTFDDAGTYGCVAKNEFGENSISANVTVTSEKDIFQGTKKGLLQPGEEPDFKWFRDGHEIEGSERLKVLFKDEEDTLALVFQHVKPEDAGLYTCVASTSSGRIACSAELTVQGSVNLRESVAPEITAELIDAEVSVGTSAMLEVKVTGFPKPKLTWSKDGKEITIGGRFKFLHEDDETISLVIKGVTSEDAGLYSVKAKNELGEVSTSGHLVVKAAPVFKKQLADVSVMNDQPVKFEAEIEGQPAPDVSWYKDGKAVEETERVKVSQTGTSHNLTITKVLAEDAGSYSVVASNSSGKISEFAKLTVNAPPQFLKEIKSIETREEEDIKFEVKVAGFPEPAVKWIRNGEVVSDDGSHYVIEKDDKYHSLVIHKTSRRDSGKYTCEVSNVSGSVSGTGSLVVNSVPQFVKPLNNIIVKEDDTFIAFEATSSGYPKPTITWYIDSMEITESNNKFKIEEDGSHSHTLLLKQATFESRGKYSCKITNIHGEASSDCTLDVHTIPRFTEKIKDEEVTENVDVNYSVTLTGNPTPKVVWTKDHQEVNVTANVKLGQADGGVHTLTLTGVTEESAGTYQCKASNSEGDAVTISKLVVNKVTKRATRQESEENINKKTVRQNSKSDAQDSDISKETVTDDATIKSKTTEDEQIVSVRKKKRKDRKVESYSMSSVQQSSFAYVNDNGNVKMAAEFSSEVITERSLTDSSGTTSEKTKEVAHEKIGDLEETLKIMELNDEDFSANKESEETGETRIDEGVITETPEETLNEKKNEDDNDASASFSRRHDGPTETPEDAGLTITEVIDDVVEPSPDENTSGDIKKYVVKDKPQSEDEVEKEPADEGTDSKMAPGNGNDVDDDGKIRKRINILEEEEIYDEVIEEQWIDESIEKEDENDKKVDKKKKSNDKEQVLSKNKRNEASQDEEAPQTGDKSVNGQEVANGTILNGDGRSPTPGLQSSDDLKSQKASNKAANENGTKALVDDNSAHPRFEGEMQGIEVWNGEPGTLEAIGISIPYPEVKWFKDGEQLMDTKEIKITDDGKVHRLHIKKTVPEDTGSYKIELSNKIGTASQEAKIRIKASSEAKVPVVMKTLEDIVLIEGSHATFEAKIFANPAALTQWYKDDHPLIEGDHYEISENAIKHTYKLVIKNATYNDVAKYTLTATNSNGEVSTSAALDVQVKPVIGEIKDKKAMPDSSVYFEAKITGTPTPSVKWVKGTTDLVENSKISFDSNPESGVYRLNLKKLTPEDGGQYTVVAENVADTAKMPFNLNVTTEPPKFIKGLQNIGGKLNSPLKLEVHVYGLPMPSVKWFSGHTELANTENIKLEQVDERNFSLTIVQFTDEFSATYTCKAFNQAGEAVSSGVVSLTKGLPEFLKKLPKEVCIIDGEPILLEAKLDNNPMPKIQWQKDGKNISPDERVHIEQLPNGTCRLSIENGVPEDKGRYSLVATNDAGQTSSTGQVVVEAVPKPPSFLKKLDNADVPQGTTLKLSAKVTAHPRPVAKWLKNGKPLKLEQRTRLIEDQAGNFGLEIDDVKPEDEGKYTLQVSNHQGEASSDSNVTVKTSATPPDFTSPLKSANATEGAPSRLEAKVRGSPSTYKWYKDGAPYTPDETRVKSISRPDGTVALLFEKTKPSDAGKYTLEAINPNGSAKTDGDLSVQPRDRSDIGKKAPRFVSPISALTADEGKPFKLQAQIEGNPYPDITWLRDEQPLKMSDVRFFNCDGDKISMEIKKASPKDGGLYTCKLSNSEGDASSDAKVAVNKLYSAPNFTQRFTDMFTIPGGDPRFIGRVHGVPKADISWYFNDQPIFDSPKYKIRRDDDLCALQIKGVTAADKGRYTCRASNDAGCDSCSAGLDITDVTDKKDRADPPSFLKKLGDCSAIEGMAGKFTACVAGFPEPTFKWYKDGREITKDPTDRVQIQVEPHGLLRLIVKNAKPQDLGKYTLKISNPHGEAESSAQLIFDNYEDKAPRERMADLNIDHDKFRRSAIPFALPDKPIISKMTDRRLTLSWKPYLPVGPGMPVTYIVDMCEVSNGDWFSARQGIRGCCCEIRNLEPFRDYKFRVRVENKYGVSDPSPFATAYRPKLEMTPPRQLPRLPTEIDFRPETSVYFPKDYDIDRPLHEEYAHAPRFLRPNDDTQYGARGEPTSIEWWVYGYPTPEVRFKYNDVEIENRERYEWAAARNGQCKLYLSIMTERDVGIYECIARNEHGEARQRIHLAIAEHPEFIMHLDEENIMLRQSGALQCRVIGAPYPNIKWFKDWHPIVASNRIKIEWKEPDLCTLTISDSIHKDAGLYSCVACNIAGTATSSAMVHIEEDENDYSYLKYSHSRVVRARQRPFEDSYDIGDELGRGTQGKVYHAVERSTGNSYAAKVMHVRSDTMPYARRELDIMNQLHDRHLVRAREAFETKNSVTLVTDIAAGGELFDTICKQTTITESEIAGYVRQILWGLDHMHSKGIGHLGLTPGDILLAKPGGDDIKICDFGLASRIIKGKDHFLNFGMPEFVAPEVVHLRPVTFGTDMWSVGVITYLLLSGISPFLGETDRETLKRIQKGQLTFDSSIFTNVSDEAKDFLSKLLVFDSEGRMDVKSALKHPWLRYADRLGTGNVYSTDRLRDYCKRYRDWVRNSAAHRFYRRRPLSFAFDHPSGMLYPPGEEYTPPSSPEASPAKTKPSWDKKPQLIEQPSTEKTTHTDRIESREHEDLNNELGYADSNSQYQNGPDTYLLQLRDVGFPLRLRQYMRLSAACSPTLAVRLHDNLSGQIVTVRERRRFTDVMDEEIDDEKKGQLDGVRRRINSEISPRSETKNRIKELLPRSRENERQPFFLEKLQDTPLIESEPVELSCLVIGEPKPTITWYRNDVLLSESHRVKIEEDAKGRCIIKFGPAKGFDAGVYKVVARNPAGEIACRARLKVGDTPGKPEGLEFPQISDSEVLITWHPPKYDGNSPIVAYNLEYKEIEEAVWHEVAKNIDHRFMAIRNLKPTSQYHFRVRAMNRFGWGDHSNCSETITTGDAGSPKVQVSRAMKHQQEITENGKLVVLPERRHSIDYSIELEPIELSTGAATDKYQFVSELSRGRFSVVVKCSRKDGEQEVFAAKLLECNSTTEEQVQNEYDILRKLRHERIPLLYEAYRQNNILVLIQEKLQGYDILTYLTRNQEYTEDSVARSMRQVLDALEYLHFRSIVHLDVQPDNVVVSNLSSGHIKLVDFGSAQVLSKYIPTKAEKRESLDYLAPELVSQADISPHSDVWGAGVLMYILLSGVSPFIGENRKETAENIMYVRYRFEHIYKEATPEATRFLMAIFKKTPQKRPTADECLELKWLNPSEFILKKRERSVFQSSKLQAYAEEYHKQRQNVASKSENLLNAFGTHFSRSVSVEYDTLTTF